jgi:cyclomaltodextrinase / maltogenic alpha-amylase / neopullulanase
MTYYGDENGMWSPDDPSNRQPMVWKDKEPYDDPEVKFDDDLFAFYQRAIAVREHFEPLQTGFFRPVKMDDEHGMYAFARELGPETVYVIINRSPSYQSIELPIAADGAYVDWLDPSQAELKAGDDRPTVSEVAGAKHMQADHGTLTIALPRYGTAVLSPAK